MKELKDLSDLLCNEVQALYSAEKLQITGLTRMIEKTENAELKAAFSQHLEETHIHKERLEKAAKLLNIEMEMDGNPAIKGLIAEGEKIMHKESTPEALDATLIAGAQKIEHYEISGYGSAKCYAEELGLTEVAHLMNETLIEEQATDTRLNDLAKRKINMKAQEVHS